MPPGQAAAGEGEADLEPEDKSYLLNGVCLSKEAQDALANELKNLKPLQPHHLQEARRVMNASEKAVLEKPKSMFLRKRFR